LNQNHLIIVAEVPVRVRGLLKSWPGAKQSKAKHFSMPNLKEREYLGKIPANALFLKVQL
jgi:hypothetical protein